MTHVKVFSGADRSVPHSFLAYGLGFTGGVRVGGGRLGWGRPGRDHHRAGIGWAPLVRIFEGGTLAVLDSFFAFPPASSGARSSASMMSGRLHEVLNHYRAWVVVTSEMACL